MSTTLAHSPFRPGRTREEHAREVRIACMLLCLAHLLGVGLGVSTGQLAAEIYLVNAAAVACCLAGGFYLTPDNAHHVERALLLVNLPILVSVSYNGVSAGALFYYVPAVLHIVYSERYRPARIALIAGYAAGFALSLHHYASGAYVPAARETRALFEYADALFALLLTGFNLRRFRRFNGAARAELAAREAVLEEHGARWREGREALVQKAREIERLAAASSLSIGRERAARAQIEAQGEEVRQFAYAASHDLKEPVRTIRSFVQMTRRRLPPEYELPAESAEFFDYIDGATGGMSALLDRLLLYSRAERVPADVTDVPAERLLLRLGTDARVRVARVPEALAGATLPVALARFEAIAGELIGNALRFSGSETAVTVGLRPATGGGAEFYVADRGVGIPAEYAERVFGLFQRLHGKDAYPGHGVGLALCRRLVDGDESRLRLLAREGGGTEAVLRL